MVITHQHPDNTESNSDQFLQRAIESILTGNITISCGSCTVQDWKALQQVIKTSQNITGTIYRLSVISVT